MFYVLLVMDELQISATFERKTQQFPSSSQYYTSHVTVKQKSNFCIFVSYESFLSYAFVFSLTDYLSKRMRSVIQFKSYLGSGRD